ncbi:MAG: hypothetical protein J6W82_04520 [Bacteroidales bacterium]|nr:hypothetical protein [Bacteroidales bacterium]
MNLKHHCIAVFALLLLCSAAFAAEPYFVTSSGRKLHYERYKAGTGKVIQTTLVNVTGVRKAVGARQVDYWMSIRKADGRELYGGRLDLTSHIKDNGDVLTDFGGTIKCVVKNHFPNVKVTSSGDMAIVPAVMRPGETLPDAHCVVSVSGFQYTVDLTERTVLRRETLKTPAGSFDCIVAREHRCENGPMHHNDIWTDTWYAPGIGYVRHDHYDKKMRLESSEVLVRDER